jgi:hypothetical protein
MELTEWCEKAQAMQNDARPELRSSHLYANYRHSIKINTLPTPVADFVRCLGSPTASATTPHDLIDQVKHFYYRPDERLRLKLARDFRLTGPRVGAKVGDIFFNLQLLTSDIKSTLLRPWKDPPGKIRWLTKIEAVSDLLLGEHSTGPVDELQFFKSLVMGLGLKRGSKDYSVCAIRLYRIKRESLLRPHALSDGTHDRFCGTSPDPHRKFGSTADSRSGKAGLPEAIVLCDDVEEIAPSEAEYVSLRTQLRAIAPWVDGLPQHIKAVFVTDELFEDEMPYQQLHSEIVSRLRENHLGCEPSSCHCR